MAAKTIVDPLEDAVAAELAAKFSMLSAEEIEAARKTARERFEAAGKKKAINDIIDAEIARLGVKTGDAYRDEPVWITIDCPPYADRLVIDGVSYLQGHSYKRPRHMIESMREMLARMWEHEADIKGESTRQKIGQYRVKNFGMVEASKSLSGKGMAA